LYHPLLSVGRLGDAVTEGAVESYFTVKDALPVFPAASVQEPETWPAAESVE
jgi:hypothetical protein